MHVTSNDVHGSRGIADLTPGARPRRAVGGDGPFGPISPRRRATMRSASPNSGHPFVTSGTIGTPPHRHHHPIVATGDIASAVPPAVRPSTGNFPRARWQPLPGPV